MKKLLFICFAFLLAFSCLASDENSTEEEVDFYQEQEEILKKNPHYWQIIKEGKEYNLRYRSKLGCEEFNSPIKITDFNFLSEVFPNLYVGDSKSLFMSRCKLEIDLEGFEELKQHFNNSIKFSYVLDFSCMDNFNEFGLTPLEEEPEYESFKVEDQPTGFAKISNIMNQKFIIINDLLEKEKNVLIACFVGQSRSVTAAMLYLMKQKKQHFLEAYYCLKKNRPISQPNGGFLNSLVELQNSQKSVLTNEIRMQVLDLFDEPKLQESSQNNFDKLSKGEIIKLAIGDKDGYYYFEFVAYLFSLNIPFEITNADKCFIEIKRVYDYKKIEEKKVD